MRNRPLIVALDYPSKKEVDAFLDHFKHEQLFVKVGMELFYSEGPALIEGIKDKGHHVFLDLKLHDIPNTVKRAMTQLARLNVDLVNVHALGGVAMMEAAMEGLYSGARNGTSPMCIAVTQLTSTSEEMMNKELKIDGSLSNHVFHLCKQVERAKLDGVVCSAIEVPEVKEQTSSAFYTVTPGIRRNTDERHDQHRVVTPKRANQLGSDAIVVGRGITRADDPLVAYNLYQQEWSGREHE
ncbi:orotidine-5'-phosphate decarboxylase [Bacillus shivajii]|uniref:orotidine-5'-phosphate decarboxylase n=1 Tax=Bacillus shivajii TaxID=1983719 RepID=UPI001CFA15A8|nr:orotidine-5'-phosphate decarboxylase [Bacillus shivajii]UCZ51795.1 orotidine-5'-phosphate decarboxylase [Bacillus shivajii]